MNKYVSVVIPTLQKNVELLDNLVAALDNDIAVKEIIVIDNSTKGYTHNSSKLRVITPEENIFVNPAWNLGVKEAKEEIVALLNDDITIPENFCKDVIEKMTPSMGIVGFDGDFVENNENVMPPPGKTNMEIYEQKLRNLNFGIVMFFYKTAYVMIPEQLKIFFGDDWIFDKNLKSGRRNYKISGQKIYHCTSMTSGVFRKSLISKNDKKIYEKEKYNFIERLFRIEPIYNGIKIKIFGISFVHHYSKNH